MLETFDIDLIKFNTFLENTRNIEKFLKYKKFFITPSVYQKICFN